LARSELSRFESIKRGAREFGDQGAFMAAEFRARQARERIFGLQTGAIAPSAGGLTPAKLGPLIGAVTVATAAIAGMAAAYAGLARKAIQAANAEQSFERQTRATFSSFQGSREAGNALYDLIDGLAKRLPQSRAQLVDWTKSLQASGITDQGVLRRGVGALAGAQALGGNEGAETLLGTIRRIQEAIQTNHGLKLADRQLANLAKTGANVDDVAKELGMSTQTLQQRLKAGKEDAGAFGNALLAAVEKKGRGPLKAMWFDLDVLEKKGLELGQRLFKNVDLSEASDAVQRLFALLDQSTAAGSDLEKGIRKGTNGIVRGVGEVVDAFTIAYLNIAAFALKVDTALMPVERTIGRITKALGTTLPRLVMGALSLGTYDPVDRKTHGPKPTEAGDSAVSKLYTAAGAVARARVLGALKGEDLAKAGDALSESLASGIKQGLITHEEGVKLQGIALGKAAVEGAKKGAETHSPSRATILVGAQLGAGLAIGMRGSAPVVARAAAFLGTEATRASLYLNPVRDRRGEPGTRSAAGNRTEVHAQVNITAPEGVTNATELSAWGLAVALEREQLMGGG
jgi:hypothetical protein